MFILNELCINDMDAFKIMNCYHLAGSFNLKGGGLIHKGFVCRSQRQYIPRSKVGVIRAVAIPLEPAPVESAEYRKELAERYGFNQIGEPLPDSVTLKDVITSLPKKVRCFFL